MEQVEAFCRIAVARVADLHSKGRRTLGKKSLQQSDGLGVISFKSQLAEFGSEGTRGSSPLVYINQQFSGFLYVTFGLIHGGLKRHQLRIVWDNVQRAIVELYRDRKLSKHDVGRCRADK